MLRSLRFQKNLYFSIVSNNNRSGFLNYCTDNFLSDESGESDFNNNLEQNTKKVDPTEALDILSNRIKEQKSRKEFFTNLKPTKEEEELKEYSPIHDDKYNIKDKITKKSSTYLDFIRLVPKKKVEIPMDFEVTSCNKFNRTLLELFTVGNITDAQNYFFKILRRDQPTFYRREEFASPINLQSFNITIAELVSAGEVFLASTFFNLLEKSKFSPDIYTFNAMISGCVKYGSLSGVNRYLYLMKEAGIEENNTTKEYLISLYLKIGDIDTANNISDEIGGIDSLSPYLYGLYARAYAKINKFDLMDEFAWNKNNLLSQSDCNYIANQLLDSSQLQQLDEFIRNMHTNRLKFSYTVSQRILSYYSDERYGYPFTPNLEHILGYSTAQPTRDERVRILREGIEVDDEREASKLVTSSTPTWKTKVEYKSKESTAWDTLIQEYLDIAIKERKMQENAANFRRLQMDGARTVDPPPKESRPKPKQRKQWKM